MCKVSNFASPSYLILDLSSTPLPSPPLPLQQFKMWNFLIIMGIFLGIDIVYLTFWSSVFKFHRNIHKDEVRDVCVCVCVYMTTWSDACVCVCVCMR